MSEALNLSKVEAKRSSRRDDAPQEGRKMRSKEQSKDDADVPTKPASELATKPGKENPLAGASSEPKPGKENSAFEANSTTSSTKTLPGGGSDFLKDMSSGVKPEKTDAFQPEYRDAPAGPAMHLHPLHPTAIPGLPGYGHLGYGLFPGLHPAPRPEEALAGCEDVEILYDSGEPVIEVECGENKAFLYINKLCQGSKGPSIRLSNEMLTPNEFQFISGRETAKDWKRSIRHKGKSLKTLMAKGILQVHPPICDCPGCRISSPVAAMLQNRGRLVEKRGGPAAGRRRGEENQSDDGENAGEGDEEHGSSSGKKSNLSSIISHLYCSASSASGGSGTAGDRAAASSPNDSSSGETAGLEGLGLRGVQGGRKRGRGRAGSAERREAAGQAKRRRSASPPQADSPPTNGEDTSAAAYLSSDYRQRLLSALNNEQGTYEEQQQRIYQLANSVEPDRGAQENSKENGVLSRRSSPGSPSAGDGPDRPLSPVTAARHSPHKPPLPPHMDPAALPRDYLETGGHFFTPHTPHIALGAHLRPPFLGFPHLLSPAHLGYTFLRPGETTPQELLARQNDLLRKRYADQMNTEILLRQQEAFRRYASLSREQQRRLAGEPLSAVPGVLPPDPHLMHPAYAADSPLLYPSEQARRNAMLVLRHAPEVSPTPAQSRERASPLATPQEAPTSHTDSESFEKVSKEDREGETPEEGPLVNGDVSQDASRPESPSESTKDSESESQPERPSSRDSNASSNNNECTCKGVACCRDNNIREPEETIASWTVDDVYQFIKSLGGCSEYAQAFKDQAIDGETLPMLHEELLQNQLGMKLGPALKIRAQVAKRQGRCSICFHCLHCHKGQNSVTSEDPPQSPSPAASCS
ncbi:PREDICTED: sterile alpha motif domain-containing protein 11-like [Branchiostoma belcheri]|uniref:Sterile alpha motif domain-containing protein 11-like n=1 Tax=Branchiostoma belcheri TaxID=7741 RepID=A0A6P4Y7G5_BRABE|nr:PREDICTED: sterile alpha motif domain-containing protein 11-like [Branchiostoma belcheri]